MVLACFTSLWLWTAAPAPASSEPEPGLSLQVAGPGAPRGGSAEAEPRLGALGDPSEPVEFWDSPLVWVAGAVLGNLALAVGVLLAFRRRERREGSEAAPPADR